ncbi:metal-dependent phosphohydrolase [Chloroflexota bacterium]
MLNLHQLAIEHFVSELKQAYRQTYSRLEPQYANLIEWTGRLALENIANSDSLFHDVEHTMMVSLVGQAILKGKHLMEGGITPGDWLHFTMALLCHDIGYVRGVCKADRPGQYASGIGQETVQVSDDGTNAALTPYHVDRSKLFVKERFGKTLVDFVDAETINRYIEMTRFPVPDDPIYKDTGSYGGLLRAADFIGQLGDPGYLRKIPALFYEFEETGENLRIGYKSPGHMRKNFSTFYFNVVVPFISDAIHYLNVTQEGRLWLASLYAHVHKVEHQTI